MDEQHSADLPQWVLVPIPPLKNEEVWEAVKEGWDHILPQRPEQRGQVLKVATIPPTIVLDLLGLGEVAVGDGGDNGLLP